MTNVKVSTKRKSLAVPSPRMTSAVIVYLFLLWAMTSKVFVKRVWAGIVCTICLFGSCLYMCTICAYVCLYSDWGETCLGVILLEKRFAKDICFAKTNA
jgi:hypothetical protein